MVFRSIFLIFISLFLISCVSTGNTILKDETESTVAAKITKGVTTKDQVQLMFGSPFSVTFSTEAALETWTYEFADLKMDGENFIPFASLFGSSFSGTKKMLVIIFNDDNTVLKYSMSESPYSQKSGVFNN